MAQTKREKLLQHLWFKAMCRTDEWFEAAEFEARVSKKLADVFREVIAIFSGDTPPLPCKYCPASVNCKLSDDCKDGIIKWARLSVEEEMDNAEAREG